MKCVDSQLVAQVKAMLEDPAKLEQELKAVRELAALVELTLQQARGLVGGLVCSPAVRSVQFRIAGSELAKKLGDGFFQRHGF